MTISGHKTIPVFRRYNVFTDDELQDVKWINDENSVSVWFSKIIEKARIIESFWEEREDSFYGCRISF